MQAIKPPLTQDELSDLRLRNEARMRQATRDMKERHLLHPANALKRKDDSRA